MKPGGRRLVGSFIVLGLLLTTHYSLLTTEAWADEPSNAALKAEIEALKARLASLERQLVTAEFRGTTGIGEKAGVPGLVELPSGLKGLALSGYADVSYIYNFGESDPATSANTGRVFDTESNGFTPQAFELVVEKPMTDEAPIGFRTDLFFGDDAENIHATGLPTLAAGTTEAFDLQQAYITARAPIGEGIDFKVGKFVTLLGAEVIESPANWNFSRSYMFGFSIPFTHTGVLASYPLGEWGSATAGVVNGWDIVDDNNKAKSLIGNVTLTPLEKVTLSFNGITGAEQSADSRDKRTVFDFVGTYQPLEKLTLMANYDYGHESGLTQGTGAVGGFEAANWQGLALYAKYDLTDTWSLAGRWEWFDDKDNVRTKFTSIGGGIPTDIDFYEWTLTSQWKLHEHLLARLEYRHDKADEQVFRRDEGLTSYMDTIAAELIYHF
jgi:hypothetical protein